MEWNNVHGVGLGDGNIVKKGPNYIWHIDGYDKLKPYGFCVHGAIDGYSRRIMWLEVGRSNNNPRLVVSYFLDCVKALGGTPRIIRGDQGTENVNVAAVCSAFFVMMTRTIFLARRVSCMDDQCQSRGLKRGGDFWEDPTPNGGSIFLKI